MEFNRTQIILIFFPHHLHMLISIKKIYQQKINCIHNAHLSQYLQIRTSYSLNILHMIFYLLVFQHTSITKPTFQENCTNMICKCLNPKPSLHMSESQKSCALCRLEFRMIYLIHQNKVDFLILENTLRSSSNAKY